MKKLATLISVLIIGGFAASASAGIWEICAYQSYYWNNGCQGTCTDQTPCYVDF